MRANARIVRLRNQYDFQRVRRKGQKWAHPLVVMMARPNGLSHSRFGFIAGKGVGRAVRRNRAKRLLRETVRQLLPQIQVGWDVALVARRPIAERRLAEVATAVTELLQRANLLKQKGS